MRKRSALLLAAAAAALLAVPAPAGACDTPGPSAGGSDVATPAGTVYYGQTGPMGGFIGEKSDRGYIQADGDSDQQQGGIHGQTSDDSINGHLRVGANGVSACANNMTIV